MKLGKFTSIPLGIIQHGTPKKNFLPIALAAMAVGSSIYGGVKSANQSRRSKRELEAQKAKDDSWYLRQRYENTADTAAGQRLLTKAREFADSRYKRAAGQAAVTGGTEASAAMAKEAGNKVVSDTLADISANDTARKDRAGEKQMEVDRQYSRTMSAIAERENANTANAAQQASNAMLSAAVAMGGANANNKVDKPLAGGSNASSVVETPKPKTISVPYSAGDDGVTDEMLAEDWERYGV